MVLVPVGVLLSDGTVGVEEAAENRAFFSNAIPILL